MLTIVSASRRTDLVGCFPEKLSHSLAEGCIHVPNPISGKTRMVDLRPETVHTLVLWSKNFTPLLENRHQLRTRLSAYRQLYFQFTLTGLGGTFWEPGVPLSGDGQKQFKALVAVAGHAERVLWRFDPLVFWEDEGGIRSNLGKFPALADAAAEAGIKRVMVSLCHGYRSVEARTRAEGLRRISPATTQIQEAASRLLEWGTQRGLDMHACCTPELRAAGFQSGPCIDAGLLTRLHPDHWPVSARKDPGQRPNCGCAVSADIGAYDPACPHACLYCYAHPIRRRNES